MKFVERVDLAQQFNNLELLEEFSEPPQSIKLFKHDKLGKLLIIDREVQHVEAWQALYHEPLIHLTASFIQNIEKALILGGGSLFAAKEILRYPTLKKCILIDHDERVIDLMCRYYDHASTVISDNRFKYYEMDASVYIKQCKEKFDIIINDCFDLVELSLNGEVITFKKLTTLLKNGGACSDLIYRHIFEKVLVRQTISMLNLVGKAAYSLVIVPEYPGVLHLLAMWGNDNIKQKSKQTLNEVQLKWQADSSFSGFQYYSLNYRSFYLYLPPYIKRMMQ